MARTVVAPRNLRVAQWLTIAIVALEVLASAGGLFIPGLYRDTPWVVPQNRGQDLVTLILSPVLVVIVPAVRRGSARATMAWIGLLGYVFYTYTGAAFAFAFNRFFLIYVALFSLSIAALVAVAGGIDAVELQKRFDRATPRWPVLAYLAVLALMLTALWLGQIVPFFTTGTIPESIRLSGGPTMFVYVLDLGVVVPLALLAAAWLWRRLPWGYVLAGCVLIKGTTMGLALLSMSWFAARAGILTEPGLAVIWVALAAGSLGMSFWFFRQCRG
ncbi:MAG: hypothetical protein ACM3WT_02375 [Bacillota bacterium]